MQVNLLRSGTNQAREIPIYRSLRISDSMDQGRSSPRQCKGDRRDSISTRQSVVVDLYGSREGRRREPVRVACLGSMGAVGSSSTKSVKTDIRSARPGGTPFEYEGQLYRPAQDCSKTGGGKIVLNRVGRLTPTEFSRRTCCHRCTYADTPYQDGLHTLSAAEIIP